MGGTARVMGAPTLVIAAVVALVLALAGGDASAQGSCLAADELELAACITNANAGTGSPNIALTANIALTGPLPDFNNTAAFGSFLQGNGYTIDADGQATRAIVASGGSLVITAIGLTGATIDGIWVSNDAYVAIAESTIYDNLDDGLYITSSNEVRITNSTVTGNGDDGIEHNGSGALTVALSTIAFNDYGIWNPGSGTTDVVDSLSAGNTTNDCFGILTDSTDGSLFGDNTCTGTTTPGLGGSLGLLADNGCSPGLPACTKTIAIGAESPAVDAAGSCDQTKDQRLFDRTAGSCDAGAFETGDCISANRSVNNESELAFAIGCYNSQRPAGNHHITVTNHIQLSKDLPEVLASSRMTIVGGGWWLTPKDGVLNINIFRIGTGTLAVSDLVIEGDETFFDRAFDVRGDAVLELAHSSVAHVGGGVFLFGGSAQVTNTTFDTAGVAFNVEDGGRLVLGHSQVDNTDSGVFVGEGDAIIYNSTIDDGADVGVGARGANATIYISSSTLVDNKYGLSAEDGATVSARSTLVANSTMADCRGAGVFNDSLNLDSDGTCPDFADLTGSLGPLDNNGCVVQTPYGCVRTHAPQFGSNAINGGVCSLTPTSFNGSGDLLLFTITTDQRGFARPSGAACDVGSLEVQDLPMCDGKMATIVWGPGSVATSGNDVIVGTSGADVIDALEGDDTVCAGGGDDTVKGGPGTDTIFGEGGADKLFGAQGHDVIRGGDGDDTIHGNRGNDVLFGEGGADKIFGYAHDDTIDGGEGDDRLHGNFGDDVISGGAGNDRIFGYGDADTLSGGAGNDLLTGNFGDDTIDGGADDDVLYGADGDDIVNGGPGDDIVNGNSLNDTLTGGQGNDTLDGGIDTDSCNGGPGTDTATRCETISGVP